MDTDNLVDIKGVSDQVPVAGELNMSLSEDHGGTLAKTSSTRARPQPARRPGKAGRAGKADKKAQIGKVEH